MRVMEYDGSGEGVGNEGGPALALVVAVLGRWVCLGGCSGGLGLVVTVASVHMICISQREAFGVRYSCSPSLKQATFLGSLSVLL